MMFYGDIECFNVYIWDEICKVSYLRKYKLPKTNYSVNIHRKYSLIESYGIAVSIG